jgi:hypothetical protein
MLQTQPRQELRVMLEEVRVSMQILRNRLLLDWLGRQAAHLINGHSLPPLQ